MYKYITINGDIYVKPDRHVGFWTKERKLWGATLVAIVVSLLTKRRNHERSE